MSNFKSNQIRSDQTRPSNNILQIDTRWSAFPPCGWSQKTWLWWAWVLWLSRLICVLPIGPTRAQCQSMVVGNWKVNLLSLPLCSFFSFAACRGPALCWFITSVGLSATDEKEKEKVFDSVSDPSCRQAALRYMCSVGYVLMFRPRMLSPSFGCKHQTPSPLHPPEFTPFP